MDKELEKLWEEVGNKISQLVNERAEELRLLSIEPVSMPAMCAEGGYMVGYYPEKGFDIRAYGWSPSSVKNNTKWYRSIHWGTAMGNTNSKAQCEFANMLAKEAQAVWDEGIKKLEVK